MTVNKNTKKLSPETFYEFPRFKVLQDTVFAVFIKKFVFVQNSEFLKCQVHESNQHKFIA